MKLENLDEMANAFYKCEKFILALKERQSQKEQLKNAVQLYLESRANNEPVHPTTEKFVLEFLARSMEGDAPSIRRNKSRRRNHAANTCLTYLVDRTGVSEITRKRSEVASAFGIESGAIEKHLESNRWARILRKHHEESS